ncbi:MAG: 4-hydroxyphenylacetate 3-hydroxylase N-terminal domain-containing protein, partial [Xanthobacteraceae bacterium]
MPSQGVADARHSAGAKYTAATASVQGVMDGARYTESLRDGREVWLHGEKVADVTRHPAFA